jgi:uncharacterized repeat protein (TIGR02543 family)
MTIALTLTLALTLSGCVGGDADLDGKNIVTFEVNGGTLNYGTSSTKTKINFAYYPGTYILDPTTLPNYSIAKNGYVFTGWYTSADCKPGEEWNFDTAFEQETLTLYAGWEKKIKYTYTLYYVKDAQNVSLGSYSVGAGEVFDDYMDHANKRDGYTSIGYYKNPECTEAWDFTTKHPGGDADLDIPVYVKHIEGEWELVGSFAELKSAISKGNVYLTADIDCGGAELVAPTTFNGKFNGNNYKVKNFVVAKGGTALEPSCAIFNELGADANIYDVSFENVTFNFVGLNDKAVVHEKFKAKVAALAVSITEGAKVSNVSVTGTINVDAVYTGELPHLNDAFWYEGEENAAIAANITGFTATVTVNKQS